MTGDLVPRSELAAGVDRNELLPQAAAAAGISFPELLERICRGAINRR